MSDTQKENFFRKMYEINYGWIFLSLVISLGSHLARAHRWKYLLEPMGYKTKFAHRYHAIMVGYIVNMLIPRAGEASRAGMLVKSDKIPFARSFGTIIAERAIDVAILGIIFLFTISVSFDDFLALKAKLFPADAQNAGDTSNLLLWIILAVVILFALAIVFFALKPTLRKKVVELLLNIKEGVLSVFRSKNPVSFTFYSFLIWILYVVFFGVCFLSLEETKEVPLSGILMAFIGGTIGIMLTNGGVGVYPVFVGSIITFYAFPDYTGTGAHDTAYALATITWGVQTLMMIVLGLISLFFFSKNFKITSEDDSESDKG